MKYIKPSELKEGDVFALSFPGKGRIAYTCITPELDHGHLEVLERGKRYSHKMQTKSIKQVILLKRKD